MKQILMLNYEFPPLGGGAANATKYILKEFFKYKNLQIDLVTSSTSTFKIEKFSDNITIHYLNIGKNDEIHNQNNKDLLTYTYKAYKYCKKLKKVVDYDLIHAFFGIPCGYIAKRLKLPYIVSLRGSDVPFYSKKYELLDKLFFKRLSKSIWANAEVVVANSIGLRNLALKSITEDIKVIPNGIDVDEFKSIENYCSGLKIISGSRLLERKGFKYLIEAVKKLDDVSLTIVGDGKIKDKLIKLDSSVNFTGFVKHKDIGKLCNNYNLAVFPSLNEGMSNFMLECMACGLPIISTKVGGTDELVNGNGFLIEKKSVDDIISKIEEFISNPNLISKFGKKSRKIAEKMSWNKIAKEYYLLYKNI